MHGTVGRACFLLRFCALSIQLLFNTPRERQCYTTPTSKRTVRCSSQCIHTQGMTFSTKKLKSYFANPRSFLVTVSCHQKVTQFHNRGSLFQDELKRFDTEDLLLVFEDDFIQLYRTSSPGNQKVSLRRLLFNWAGSRASWFKASIWYKSRSFSAAHEVHTTTSCFHYMDSIPFTHIEDKWGFTGYTTENAALKQYVFKTTQVPLLGKCQNELVTCSEWWSELTNYLAGNTDSEDKEWNHCKGSKSTTDAATTGPGSQARKY